MSREKLTKISGYLEKRGKLSIMGRWKKWWCVLEGQLLLYYKSRIEYTNLSPCCGSLNMALVKNVQPYVDFQIHITTHTQLIVLRTKNKERQQQWFHALVGVLPQNSYLSPLLYFSTDSIDYRKKSERKKKKSKHKASRNSIEIIEYDESSLVVKSDNDISNPANESNFSVLENHILTDRRNISASQERIQFNVMNVSSASECNLRQNTCANSTIKCSSEMNIRRYSSYHSVINAVTISERIADRRCISCECVFFTEYRTNAVQQYDFLSSCSIRSDEGSQQNNRYPGNSNDYKKSRHSIRRRSKNNSKKYNTLSRRSLSFFKKIFKRKTENQNQLHAENNSSQEIIQVSNDSTPMIPVDVEMNILESSVSESKEINTIQKMENNESVQNEIEEIEPCNNLAEQNTENTSSNNESESESSDTESDIDAVEDSQDEDKLPDLPIKNSNRLPYNYRDFKDVNSNYTTEVITKDTTNTKELSSIENCPSMELDSLLHQLSVLNNECDKSHESLEFQNNIIEDPDYDIPRPHTSLISDAGSMSDVYEKNRLEVPRHDNLSTQKYDSLSIDMAPDSLEMPWLLNDSKCNMNYWTTKKEFDLCLENDSGSESDYHDSLNSNKYT